MALYKCRIIIIFLVLTSSELARKSGRKTAFCRSAFL